MEVEDKLGILQEAKENVEQVQKLIAELQSKIFKNFQVKLGTDIEEVKKDISSLTSFYLLLKNTQFPITSTNSGFFSLLPTELMLYILSFLDARSLIKCRKINWEFKRFSEENTIWKILCTYSNHQVFWRHDIEPDWKEVWRWYYECEKQIDPIDPAEDQGQLVRGKREIEGAVYKGEWKNNMKDGKGIQVWQEGDIYKGEWKKGKRTGQGIHIWPDGHYYEGSYDDDKRNGMGIFKWPDGREYRGNYVDDQRNGHGEFIWPNGDKYVGMYKSSNRNGRGIFTWHDGRKYDGEWLNGGYHGIGVYTHRDSCKYQGQWKDNMRHGKGKFEWADGGYYDGSWIEGKRVGKGILVRHVNGIGEVTEEQTWNEDKFDKHNKGIPEDPNSQKKRKTTDGKDKHKTKKPKINK